MSRLIEALYGLSAELKDRFFAIGHETVPVNYYTRHNNWGDQLNKYLIEKITNKVVVKNSFKERPHILAIGSVLSSASGKSIVWGSGFISKEAMLKHKSFDIRAVRGLLTKKKLEDEFSILCPDVMGDPAVLISHFYDASHINKKHKIGIIPHYKDKKLPVVQALLKTGCVLIDIQEDIEPFIDKLNECEYILSSSLHGLIAADTYNIPNLWVEFSDKVLGNGFKFLDYYSTTDIQFPEVTYINSTIDLSIEELIKKCRKNSFIPSRDNLLAAFPKEYL